MLLVISNSAGAFSLSRPPVARMIVPSRGSLYWGASAAPFTCTPAGTLRLPLTRYLPAGIQTVVPVLAASFIAA